MHYFAALLVFLTLLSSAAPAAAGELMVHGLTWHGTSSFDTSCGDAPCMRNYNGVNPGLGYVFDNGTMLGIYRNSYYKTSAYVAYRYLFDDHFGVFGGYATGYRGRGAGGWIGGLIARTGDLGDGWRIGLAGQPLQAHRLDAIVAVYASKSF